MKSLCCYSRNHTVLENHSNGIPFHAGTCAHKLEHLIEVRIIKFQIMHTTAMRTCCMLF